LLHPKNRRSRGIVGKKVPLTFTKDGDDAHRAISKLKLIARRHDGRLYQGACRPAIEFSRGRSNRNPFDLVEGDLVAGAIVEFGRARFHGQICRKLDQSFFKRLILN
jgi:hypothetical protein